MARLVFVCWGNICRSPMAEVVARQLIDKRGLGVEVDSAGISGEERGNPLDSRAARTLERAGYVVGPHQARQVKAADLDAADLVVAVEPYHVDLLRRLAPAARIVLLNDFNPAKPAGTPLADPWYGSETGFAGTLADIEAAMPAIVDEIA